MPAVLTGCNFVVVATSFFITVATSNCKLNPILVFVFILAFTVIPSIHFRTQTQKSALNELRCVASEIQQHLLQSKNIRVNAQMTGATFHNQLVVVVAPVQDRCHWLQHLLEQVGLAHADLDLPVGGTVQVQQAPQQFVHEAQRRVDDLHVFPHQLLRLVVSQRLRFVDGGADEAARAECRRQRIPHFVGDVLVEIALCDCCLLRILDCLGCHELLSLLDAKVVRQEHDGGKHEDGRHEAGVDQRLVGPVDIERVLRWIDTDGVRVVPSVDGEGGVRSGLNG
mmetsp:Transcript_11951/g.34550  ORF Transcript_11951/g.34550 Transcript_11951/m.34550 type:complete len:282 (-) Transcript_11951:331-1176(-)